MIFEPWEESFGATLRGMPIAALVLFAFEVGRDYQYWFDKVQSLNEGGRGMTHIPFPDKKYGIIYADPPWAIPTRDAEARQRSIIRV
jgi:hypothetical protein